LQFLSPAIQPGRSARYETRTCFAPRTEPQINESETLVSIADIDRGAIAFSALRHPERPRERLTAASNSLIFQAASFTHCSNIVEHPELVAERIIRYAKLVGLENVIGGSDCGFSSQAAFTPEIHPTVVWAKFQAMAEGAQIATKQLWS
jgi:5-methyltetrahydropteroyltriglutamate--homocysteine methyltransferase